MVDNFVHFVNFVTLGPKRLNEAINRLVYIYPETGESVRFCRDEQQSNLAILHFLASFCKV